MTAENSYGIQFPFLQLWNCGQIEGASLLRTLKGFFYRSASRVQVILMSGNVQSMLLLTLTGCCLKAHFGPSATLGTSGPAIYKHGP